MSLWLTLRFCRQLWPEEGGLLLVGIGVTWDLGKMRFGAIGLRRLTSGAALQRIGGAGLVAVTGVLMAGSVAASMAYFDRAEAEDQGRRARESRRYQETAEDLKALDAQLAVLAASAAADAAQGFRKRALATAEAMSGLRQERRQAVERLAISEMQPLDAPAAATPTLSPWSMRAARRMVHLVVAVMLELIGLAAGCMCTLAPREPPTASDARDATALAHALRLPRPATFAPHRDASARYVEARELVRKAQVPPTYRALQKALCVGQATAQHFLAEMQAEGMLRRVGRRFELVA